MKAGPAANPVFESIAGSAVGTAEGPRGLITYAITASPTDLKKCDIKIERQLDRSLIQALSANALLDDIITIIASTDSCSACAEH
jgi:Ni,Fe-hydrogenase III large subunit